MPTLFFDLDGTLIDSAVGITRCVAYALRRLDQPVPDDATLRRWIGPALRTSFAPLLRDPDQVERAVALYRERFEDIGWQEHQVYDGVAEVLAGLRASGWRLAVVTAKNEPHARRILGSLPFGAVFEEIVGATADGRLSHKPELIAEALRRIVPRPQAPWMIGDRHMDMEGARHHALRSVGVLWGFGEAQELREAGATHLAAHPRELPGLVGRPGDAPD